MKIEKSIEVTPTEIKITAKPSKITVDDLNNIYTIHDVIIDRNKQLYDWWNALDKEKMLSGQEKFNMMLNGIWEKEKPMIKKEGNEMIESMNLIDLYASKHKEKIENETKEKVEELRQNCDVINKFNELVEQFKKDCDELYLSQFTEEEINEIVINHEINDSDMQLKRNHIFLYNYEVNKDFKSDEYYDVMNERNKMIHEIDDLVKTVKAHVGIAKTKEEVEEILTRYEIIDKKGKLVI